MGLQKFRRDRGQFNRLNYRLKTLLLGLSVLIILVSVLLAIVIFGYVFDIATNPLHAKSLVDQWSMVFMDNPTIQPGSQSAFTGPARWFAIVTLIILAYLLIRIPLLMLQMGTQLLMSCQEDTRRLRSFIRELLRELKHPDGEDDSHPHDLP